MNCHVRTWWSPRGGSCVTRVPRDERWDLAASDYNVDTRCARGPPHEAQHVDYCDLATWTSRATAKIVPFSGIDWAVHSSEI